ncbi:hypothetical protein VaNZ11_008284 [Volvox africanus]|uniref:Uncharacterized protein n=1 Tax=Volvox africanus TaxID=51714 RepID=A0ABQ5S4R4_9CHLO|nr:hypothetical protein VaNZ11_008284 [Volvox africanus]
MPQIEPVNPEDYNALRMRVHHLKQKHTEAVQQQHAQREVDLASIASRCAQLEALNESLLADNEKLQVQLRQSTERGAKLRRQQEREQQKLREQIEKLTSEAATVDENWAGKLAKAESEAALRVEKLQAEIADLKRQQEAEVERLKKEHEERLQDTDEWCRGEIEAVRHNARAQIAQAHGAVEQWQQKYDEESSTCRKLSDANKILQADVDELRAAVQAREGELKQANAVLLRMQKQHDAEQQGNEAEKQALKQRYTELLDSKRVEHAEQLAHIEGRLQAVVAKKDATISALRAELQNTYSTLLPLKSI